MARTGTEAHSHNNQPLRPGEQRSSLLTAREAPSNYSKVLYVVHPSIGEQGDGDTKSVAKGAIQQRISQTSTDTRIITIVPPNDSVYLKAGTPTTDIRMDSEDYRWVTSGDISPQVRRVTLVGGHLELCLGSVAESIRREMQHPLTIELPLNAIYTTHDIVANDMLRYLIALGASPSEAITALLTTVQPRTSYGIYGSSGEYEVIPSSANLNPYRLQLNGQDITTLTPLAEAEPEPLTSDPTSRVTWIPAPPKEPLPEITLAVEADLQEGINDTSIPAGLRDLLVAKIAHAREVIERYQKPEAPHEEPQATPAPHTAEINTPHKAQKTEHATTLQKERKRWQQIQELLKKLSSWRKKGPQKTNDRNNFTTSPEQY